MVSTHGQRASPCAAAHRTTRACLLLALTAGAALGAGCAGTSSILAARLEDGRTVGDIVPRDTPTALLVYDVRTCMMCGVALPVWRSLMRDTTVAVKLILVGDLSDQDRRILRLQRIAVSGTIARRSITAESLPSEYLLVEGAIHSRAVGQQTVRTRRLWAHLKPLAEAQRSFLP